MELIQIGENALKVTLTRADMEYYDIDFEGLDYANSETRRALHRILDEAKRTLGFEASREKLYIQAFADADGGCELFVRRAEEAELHRHALYRFADMDALLTACAQLANCGFVGESAAYIGDSGAYYLHLLEEESCLYLTELGTKLPPQTAFLREHTQKICDQAVATLAPLK